MFSVCISLCRLEKSVNNIERMREGISKKYRELHIPWTWMMDAGVVGEVGDTLLTSDAKLFD